MLNQTNLSSMDGIELLFNKKKSIASMSEKGSFKNFDTMSMRSGSSMKFNNNNRDEISVISDSIEGPEVVECNVNDIGGDYETEEESYGNNDTFSNNDFNIKEKDHISRHIDEDNFWQKKPSQEDINDKKRELLYQFERLEKKGIKLPKKFSMSSDYNEIKYEYNRIKKDIELDSSIKMQKKVLMTTVNGIEILNNKFDPIGARLNGWSSNVYEDLDSYDDIFEELHEKYRGKTNIPPEVRLLMGIGGSAFMYHMSNSFSKQLPGLDEILKNNPEIARKLASATAEHMTNQQSSANNLFGGLGSMFSGFFGGGNKEQFNSSRQPSNNINIDHNKQRPNMKGPDVDLDELLRRADYIPDNKSILTDSDMESLSDILESVTKSRSSKTAKRSITLDI